MKCLLFSVSLDDVTIISGHEILPAVSFMSYFGDIKAFKMEVFFENELFNMCIILYNCLYIYVYSV